MNNVAIIIANYNHNKYVVSSIQSALNQTYENVKVYITNDGSKDDSLSRIIENFNLAQIDSGYTYNSYYNGKYDVYKSDRLTLIDIENSGASTARNLAIDLALKEDKTLFAICILDADDECKPNKISLMLEKMLSSDDIGVVYADYIIERSRVFDFYYKEEYKKPYEREVLSNECIVHSASLIKVEYLRKVQLSTGEFYDKKLHGPSSQGFIGCTEDYDLWLRLSNHCLMYHIPEPLTLVREDGQNQSLKMTGEIFQKNMEMINQRNGK